MNLITESQGSVEHSLGITELRGTWRKINKQYLSLWKGVMFLFICAKKVLRNVLMLMLVCNHYYDIIHFHALKKHWSKLSFPYIILLKICWYTVKKYWIFVRLCPRYQHPVAMCVQARLYISLYKDKHLFHGPWSGRQWPTMFTYAAFCWCCLECHVYINKDSNLKTSFKGPLFPC